MGYLATCHRQGLFELLGLPLCADRLNSCRSYYEFLLHVMLGFSQVQCAQREASGCFPTVNAEPRYELQGGVMQPPPYVCSQDSAAPIHSPCRCAVWQLRSTRWCQAASSLLLKAPIRT